ncbi:MAG: hypothetical protein HYR85_09240 [Planctomycetes bacterium]|nr:hypothetical protein [Planctomycetota bacterium]
MTRWIVIVIAALASVALWMAFVGAPAVDAGTPDSRVVIVEQNLVIGPGQHVFSAPVSIDGFARWAFQVTVRSGFPLNFDWRAVYRFESDFDWAPYDPAFSIDTFQSLDVLAPEAAIEFRNAGTGTIRVAISASMYRHRINGIAYRVTGTGQVLPPSSAIQIAPHQSAFSDAFELGSANTVFYQLQLDSGPLAMGQVLSDVQWRIFNPQDFEFGDNGGPASNRAVYGPVEAQSPHTRLRITNNSGDFVTVRVGVYTQTVD